MHTSLRSVLSRAASTALIITGVIYLCAAGCAALSTPEGRANTALRLQQAQTAANSALETERAKVAAAEAALAASNAAKAQAEAALAAAQAQGQSEAAAQFQAQINQLQHQIQDTQGKLNDASKAVSVATKIKSMVDAGKTTFSAAVQPDGSLDITTGVIAGASMLGGPAGELIAVGAPLIGMVWKWIRANQATAAAESILKGLDRASIADPALNESLNKAWEIHVAPDLTATAQKIVDNTSVT